MEHEADQVPLIGCDINNISYNNYFFLLTNIQEKVLLDTDHTSVQSKVAPIIFSQLDIQKYNGYSDDIYFTQINLETFHDYKMAEKPNQNDDEVQEEKHYDKYNCRCTNCQDKYGSLPLLVDVIEQNEDKTENRNNLDEPKPSTSQDTWPKIIKKQMKCDHCDKVFSHKGDLNKHIRKHTGEQPFTCQTCQRKFAHTSNLTRHERLHSGSRPFKCDNCSKCFSRKDKLDLHRKSKLCRSSQ